MRCKCGYAFSTERLRALQTGEERPYESFAVVRDADYKKLLRREMKVVEAKAKGKEAYLKAVARSSELVGSLMRCPACGRLVLLTPHGESVEFYAREG